MDRNLRYPMKRLIARHEHIRLEPQRHCQHYRVIREKAVLLLHLERGLREVFQRAGRKPKTEVHKRVDLAR